MYELSIETDYLIKNLLLWDTISVMQVNKLQVGAHITYDIHEASILGWYLPGLVMYVHEASNRLALMDVLNITFIGRAL